jgi:hypothetical protein
MRWSACLLRRVTSLGVVLAVTTALAACSTGEVTRTPAAGSTTQTRSPSPEREATVDAPACTRAQLTVMRRLEWPLTQVVWLVTSDLDGASAEASRRVLRDFDRAGTRLREPCGGLPEEVADLRRTVLRATARPLDVAGLGRLDRAVDEWARMLGAARPPLADVTAWVKHCRELGSQLRAGYTVGWDYTDRGRRWWVEMVIDSDLPARVWVDIGGTLWATGLPRDPYSRDDKRGGQQVEWGGSSADSLYAQPFTRSTTQVYLPGPSGYLHAAADSRVYGVRPEVFVRHGGGPACSLPAPGLG